MIHNPAIVQRAHRGLGRGFTLIEILIVVVILGILAAIVIPQFSSASSEARESTLRDCLRYLRTQITVYQAQHRDIAPGYPSGNPASAPDSASFLDQMTGFSDEHGNLAASSSDIFHFGPYLSRMPANPFTNQTGIWVVTGATMPAPDAAQPYGWIYNPESLQIIPNQVGNDGSGHPYTSY
jgi:general secretion pathway protein G